MNAKNYAIAIETSGRTGSVALGMDGKVLSATIFSGAMKHSRELFPALETLLTENHLTLADIKQVYLTAGPGSFTGLRIAVTAAKMLGYANHCKIVAVNTLDVVAQNALDYACETNKPVHRVATILDAKRNTFFIGQYEISDGNIQKTATQVMIGASEFLEIAKEADQIPIYLTGEGLFYYAKKFETHFTTILDSKYWPATARNLYKLGYQKSLTGKFTDPEQLIPNYLRKTEAEENWEKRQQSNNNKSNKPL